MSKKKTSESVQWWKDQHDHPYAHPVCEYSEHRFLAYLLLHQLLGKDLLPEKITVYSQGPDVNKIVKATQVATGITKIPVIHQLDQGFQRYDIGKKNTLIIRGALSGTIAQDFEWTAKNSTQTHPFPLVQSVRPIIPNQDYILETVTEDIKFYEKKQPRVQHLIDLLMQVEKIIESREYVPALLYLLEKLSIETDSDQLYTNSQILKADKPDTRSLSEMIIQQGF
jgi:hypothetical protein